MRNLSSHNSCNFAFFHFLGGGTSGTLCKLKTKRISGLCIWGKSQDLGGGIIINTLFLFEIRCKIFLPIWRPILYFLIHFYVILRKKVFNHLAKCLRCFIHISWQIFCDNFQSKTKSITYIYFQSINLG